MKPIPFLKPAETILTLTAQDECLDKYPDTINLPPHTFDEACWLAHYVICQSVYAGTHILHHLLTNPPGKDWHLLPLVLYRHALDLGDSIGTLLRFGSTNSAIVLVRALFETSIALEFMLEKNTFHEDRAVCYQGFRIIKRLRHLTLYDPETTEGKKLHAILDNDPRLKDSTFPRQDHSQDRKRAQEMLNTEPFRSYWEKYNEAKPRPRHWYSLCSSANDLRSLARGIGRESEYVLLYDSLSEGAHASDVISGIIHIDESNQLGIYQLRGPDEKVKGSISLAANLLIGCHNHLLFTYLTGHEVHLEFSRWYIESYREVFAWSTSPGPLFS